MRMPRINDHPILLTALILFAAPLPAIDVTVARTSAWDGGFVGELRIHNTTGTVIDGWQLTFLSTAALNSLWNVVVVSIDGDRYTVDNESWNGTIALDATVVVGFTGSGELDATTVSGCTLNSIACALAFVDEVGGTPSGGPAIAITELDDAGAVLEVELALGATATYTLAVPDVATPTLSVVTNNPDRIDVSLVGGNLLRLVGLAPGRVGVRIDDASGARRVVGVKVLAENGAVPGLPPYLALGSVSEDSVPDLEFWQDMTPGPRNKRMDIRYIYLNGGPFLGWHTWSNEHGGRARTFIRESKKLGIVPFFVFYNIPDGGESYEIDLQHIQDPAYMEAYFGNLQLMLGILAEESPDDPVGIVFEPDFLGYMAQNSGLAPDEIMAQVHTAYDAGLLVAGVDPAFDDTVEGLVRAINYVVRRDAPQAFFGWQLNLWASPPGGYTTPIPGNGIIHKTDTAGIAAGRPLIYQEASAITQYYVDAGVTSAAADFVSIDKYGLDGGFEVGAASDPANSIWFWNNDHWNNYLTFVRAMADTSGLPVVLWQIPVGHIETTQASNPYAADGLFTPLDNTTVHYEDSAPTFFLGDTFETTGARFTHFAANVGADPKLTVTGDRITWGSHMEEARDVGVIAVLFGAGVGISTDAVGSPPTDDYWWITQAQRYFQAPVPLHTSTLFADGFESGDLSAWSSTVP